MIIIDAKELQTKLKKVQKITNGGTFINIKIKGNCLSLGTISNQYIAVTKMKVENADNEEYQFQLPTGNLIPLLNNKGNVKLKMVDNILKISSERMHADLITNPYEEIELARNEALTPMNTTVKDYIFNNFGRVNLLALADFQGDSPLQVQAKDSHIKMFMGDSYTIAYLNEGYEGQEAIDFDIASYYAQLIIDTFEKDEEISLYNTPSTVEIISKLWHVSLPRIAKETIATIDLVDTVIANNINKETFIGSIKISDAALLKADFEDFKGFFGAGNNSNITFEKVAGKELVKLTANTNAGTMEQALNCILGIKGDAWAATIKVDNFTACLEKCPKKEEVIISIYKTVITIRCKSSKDSVYILARMDNKA